MNFQDESYRYNGYWEDTEPPAALVDVSENTASLLKSAFGKPVPNQERQSLRKPFPAPRVDQTKCPKLDRGNISKETKDRDNMLAKAQTLFLDAVSNLLESALESANSGNLTPEASANAALALLGNASANLSKERRKLVVKDLNKDASSLAENDDLFKEAAPMLFGEGFEQKLKNHVKLSKKILHKLWRQQPIFSRGPFPRGGGRPNRRFQSNSNHTKRRTVSGTPSSQRPQTSQRLNEHNGRTNCSYMYKKSVLNVGVSDMAIELAACKHPPAGKLRHATKNWQAITQDSWVLETVVGFKIPFVGQPYQTQPPTTSELTMTDQSAEIQSMVAIKLSTPEKVSSPACSWFPKKTVAGGQ